MDIASVKKTLGVPIEEWTPNEYQLSLNLPITSEATYESGSTRIQIEYDRTGKINNIFIEDSTPKSTREVIMALGNLEYNNSAFSIRIVEWVNAKLAMQHNASMIAGIEVRLR